MNGKGLFVAVTAFCAVAMLSGCICHRHQAAIQTATVAAGAAASVTVVLDSSDAKGIEKQGEWPEGQGGNDRGDACLFAMKGKGECKLIWRPNLPRAGTYRVSVWFGGDPNSDHATDSPFTVGFAKGKQTFKIDQTKSSGGWKVLGVFPFEAGSSGYVQLTNDASGNVVADAVQFDLVK